MPLKLSVSVNNTVPLTMDTVPLLALPTALMLMVWLSVDTLASVSLASKSGRTVNVGLGTKGAHGRPCPSGC